MAKTFITAILIAIATPAAAAAKVSALFHPYDPGLNQIAEHLRAATSTIDIAIYNIDNTSANPVFAALASPEIQHRIQTQNLKVRLLFEGYASSDSNLAKMLSFEALGIDVKHLGSSRKMHHKFAVIDTFTAAPVLITGSANWSLSSQNHYNENILFFEGEAGITYSYQNQFDLLWSISKEIGASYTYEQVMHPMDRSQTIESFFNTDNFSITGQTLRKDSSVQGFALTRQIVEAIDEAKSHIEIATTRIKLRPVYEALLRAAARGVKIQIVVSMGEYESKRYRESKRLPSCEDEFNEDCSTGHNFATYLDRDTFLGHENLSVRFKFFNLDTAAYLSKQMHSKYILVDDVTLLTGSFNWSYSAEYGHIENLVRLERTDSAQALDAFNRDFSHLWSLNRSALGLTVHSLQQAVHGAASLNCDIEAMSLSLEEIDFLLDLKAEVLVSQNIGCAALN